jgi:hypothetical protein
MNRGVPWRAVLAVLVLAAVPAGCDSTSPNDPVDIENRTDAFDFRMSEVSDFSGTYRYLWQNTGTTATLNRTVAVTSGIGTIEIQDADNAIVFSGPVTQTGTITTSAGRAGNWTVNVLLVRVAGRLEFTVRKP